jgi:Phosphoinositide phospholipase C, Ca2+-dependent
VYPMNRVSQIAAGVALACAVALVPRPGLAQTCEGDCNSDGVVMVDEVVSGVGIALGRNDLTSCASLDLDGDGSVLVYELIAAVVRVMEGCPYPRDDELRLNQIQVLGSHNSYHIRPAQPILDALRALTPQLSEPLEYDHPALGEQFENQRIRQIELDVFADPFGGLYTTPYGLELTTGDPNARIPELGAAGFKVLHIQDIDFDTVCQTFIECLEDVKAWSDAHPLHMPIMILVEAKDDVLPDFGFNFVTPLPIGEPEFDALDVEIRSVFPPAQLITPDDVRGMHATLAEAVRTDGWPTLGASRGKVLFCLDNGGAKLADYIRNHPSLQGRVLFTSSPADAPEAAFMKLNDPLGDFDEIQAAVAEGFVVRTRADADTVEARTNNTTPRDMALESGAQWVSTDYPVPDPVFGTGYMVEIPTGMPARCNPISAPAECASLDIENPAHLRRGE